MNDLSPISPVDRLHNQPAEPLPPEPLSHAQVTAWLDRTTVVLHERRTELLAALDRFRAAHVRIDDDETQGRAAEFVRQIKGWLKLADDRRTTEKKPFLDGGRAVDAWFAEATAPIRDAVMVIEALMTAFATAKAARLRAEATKAARLAAERIAAAVATMEPEALDGAAAAAEQAEVAAAHAAAPTADLTRVRGDFGAVSSLRTTWTFEVTDLLALVQAVAAGKAPLQALVPNPALLGALAKNANTRTSIPGVEWVQIQKIGVR